jgi:hypothetical protein
VIDFDRGLRPWLAREEKHEDQDERQGRHHRRPLSATARSDRQLNAGSAGTTERNRIMKTKTNVKAGLVCRKAGGE